MKTRTIILIAIAVAATSFTACEKCDNTKTLKITAKALRSANKAALSGGTQINWEAGDMIDINGIDREVTNNNGTFSVIAGSARPNGNYYAAFPSTIEFNEGNNSYTCHLGGSHEINKISIPMFACSNGSNTLNFQTPYALIALHVDNRDGERFGNSMDVKIYNSGCGEDKTITFSGGTPIQSSPAVLSSDNYSFTFSRDIPDDECTIYIPVPGGASGKLRIAFGERKIAETNSSVTLRGGTIYDINFVANVEP